MNICRRRSDCGAELPPGRAHIWCRQCLREYHQQRRAAAMETRERQMLAQQDLYVIHNPASGLVKVGRSADVRKRLNALQCSAGPSMEIARLWERNGFCEPACRERLSAWHVSPGREWYRASLAQVLEIVEQVVDQGLSEEENTSEETSLPPTTSEPTKVAADLEALADLETRRVRVKTAADVARIALEALRELGLCVSDHDLMLAKNSITEAAFGAQSGALEEVD